MTRWVNGADRISLAGFDYVVGATFAGEPVEVVASNGLVEILHAGVLVAIHLQRLSPIRVTGSRGCRSNIALGTRRPG